MSQRSAEFLRGAMQGSREADAPWLEAKYHALLAEAEAREALQGSKEKMALSRIYEIATRQLAEPAGVGDAIAMAKICTEVEAVHLPPDASVPTAAEQDLGTASPKRTGTMQVTLRNGGKREPLEYADESPSAAAVITAAERALESWREVMNSHGEWDDGCFYYARTSASELQSRIECNDTALATIAKWKEAHNA